MSNLLIKIYLSLINCNESKWPRDALFMYHSLVFNDSPEWLVVHKLFKVSLVRPLLFLIFLCIQIISGICRYNFFEIRHIRFTADVWAISDSYPIFYSHRNL